MARIFTALIIYTALMSGTEALAAGGCVDSKEEWCPPSAGPIVTWTAPVCNKGELVVQPFFYFNRTRGVFNKESNYKSYKNKDKKWQWQEQLFLQYGLTDRWEIDAQGTYQQNIRQIDGSSAQSSGFGDTYIYSAYCLHEEKGWLPCIAAWFQLKIPTGKYQKLDGARLGTDNMGTNNIEGSYDHGYGFNITKKIKPFIIHMDAIWNFPMLTRIDGVKTEYGTYAKYDLGMEYFFYKGFNLMFELNSFVKGDKREDGNYIPSSNVNYLNISPGIGWSNEKIQTLLAYQRTVAGTNTDVNDSIIFTFVCTF